ncbi:MAG: hypothetical protein PHN39_01935, partial [Candidatus Pacebacteria bacterium]|nr:hypothetical protein [Candidatus Paceibacterota bacterium]
FLRKFSPIKGDKISGHKKYSTPNSYLKGIDQRNSDSAHNIAKLSFVSVSPQQTGISKNSKKK